MKYLKFLVLFILFTCLMSCDSSNQEKIIKIKNMDQNDSSYCLIFENSQINLNDYVYSNYNYKFVFNDDEYYIRNKNVFDLVEGENIFKIQSENDEIILTFTRLLKRNIYINLDKENIIVEITKTNYTVDDFIEKIEIPYGYEWNGLIKYSLDNVYFEEINIENIQFKEDCYISPIFTKKTFKVSYKNILEEIEEEFKYGEKFELPIPKKEFYTFNGWYYNDELFNIDEWSFDKDIELVASWKQNIISLNLNSFGGEVDCSCLYDEFGNIILPTSYKNGYIFNGWYLDEFFKEKVYSLNINEYNNQILYANYSLDNENLISTIVSTKFNKHSSSYEQIALFDSSKSGYTSKYWFKIAISKNNDGYYVSNIGKSGSSLSSLGSYDYVLLVYSANSDYNTITNLDLEVGNRVDFLVDPLEMNDSNCINFISFSKRTLDEELNDIVSHLNEKYSSILEVNSNIDLEKSYDFYEITWKSSNREVISDTGVYTKPFTTRNVILEAYILGNKVFEFEVKVEGINDKSTAISTGYIYTPYTTITQTAMDCLDIIYCAFLNLDSNGDWTNLKTMTNNINNYIRDKANKSSTKIVISINQKNSGDFSNVAKSEELREKVANNILDVIKTLELDGVDIDWETPLSSEAGIFTLFMKAIYEKVKAENENYLVTAAIGGGKWAPPKYDLPNSINYLDYVNLMTYSMATGNGFYQNSLYPSTKGRTLVSCSIDESITIYNNLGVENSKILVGIPFYTTVQTDSGGPGSKTGDGKSVWYNKMLSNYPLSESMKEYFDYECGVPYRYDPINKVFISYDNEESIRIKCEYINSIGLAGTMYWQYGQDVNDMLSLAIDKYINA